MRTATILVLLACLAGCQESPMPSGYEYLKFGEKQEVILKALGGSREIPTVTEGVDVLHETKLIDDDRFDRALLGFKDGRFVTVHFFVPAQECGVDTFYSLIRYFDLVYSCRTNVFYEPAPVGWGSDHIGREWANWSDCPKKDPDVGMVVIWTSGNDESDCEVRVAITDRS